MTMTADEREVVEHERNRKLALREQRQRDRRQNFLEAKRDLAPLTPAEAAELDGLYHHYRLCGGQGPWVKGAGYGFLIAPGAAPSLEAWKAEHAAELGLLDPPTPTAQPPAPTVHAAPGATDVVLSSIPDPTPKAVANALRQPRDIRLEPPSDLPKSRRIVRT